MSPRGSSGSNYRTRAGRAVWHPRRRDLRRDERGEACSAASTSTCTRARTSTSTRRCSTSQGRDRRRRAARGRARVQLPRAAATAIRRCCEHARGRPRSSTSSGTCCTTCSAASSSAGLAFSGIAHRVGLRRGAEPDATRSGPGTRACCSASRATTRPASRSRRELVAAHARRRGVRQGPARAAADVLRAPGARLPRARSARASTSTALMIELQATHDAVPLRRRHALPGRPSATSTATRRSTTRTCGRW